MFDYQVAWFSSIQNFIHVEFWIAEIFTLQRRPNRICIPVTIVYEPLQPQVRDGMGWYRNSGARVKRNRDRER